MPSRPPFVHCFSSGTANDESRRTIRVSEGISGMRSRRAAWLSVTASLSVAVLAAASPAFGESSQAKMPPLAVVFDASAVDLPQAEIRSAIAVQLGREVTSEPNASLGQLRVGRDATDQIVVRYWPPESELERTVAVPGDHARLPLVMALVAQNLVSGEPQEMIAEIDTAGRARRPRPAAQPIAPTAPEQERPVHSGAYYRVSLGVGLVSGVYSNPVGSTSVAGISGLSIGFRAAGGYMCRSGLAFGLEASADSDGPFGENGSLPPPSSDSFVRIVQTVALSAQAFVDFYPAHRGPLHLLAGAGATFTTFLYEEGQTDTGSNQAPNFPAIVPARGPSGHLGVGYDFNGPGGWGLFARTDVAYLLGGHSSYAPVDVQLGVTMAWF